MATTSVLHPIYECDVVRLLCCLLAGIAISLTKASFAWTEICWFQQRSKRKWIFKLNSFELMTFWNGISLCWSFNLHWRSNIMEADEVDKRYLFTEMTFLQRAETNKNLNLLSLESWDATTANKKKNRNEFRELQFIFLTFKNSIRLIKQKEKLAASSFLLLNNAISCSEAPRRYRIVLLKSGVQSKQKLEFKS